MKIMVVGLLFGMLCGWVNWVVAGVVTLFPEPKLTPCGELTELRLSSEQEIKLEWSVPKFGPRPTLQGNQRFAELIFKVPNGRSIGKFDFSLAGQPCLAIAEGEEPYNPLKREVVVDTDMKIVKLLFIVNPAEAPFSLTFNYAIKSLSPSQTVIQIVPESERPAMVPSVQPQSPAATKKTVTPSTPRPQPATPSATQPSAPKTPTQTKERPKPVIPADEGW